MLRKKSIVLEVHTIKNKEPRRFKGWHSHLVQDAELFVHTPHLSLPRPKIKNGTYNHESTVGREKERTFLKKEQIWY